MWIQYSLEDETDPIVSWYCQCKAGARLVGCYAHIASVMWYIGVERPSEKKSLSCPIMPPNILDVARNAASVKTY